MSRRLANKNPSERSPGVQRPVPAAGPRVSRFHRFLKRLHAGGRSNMYGAIPYLMHAFSLDREAAFQVVCEWVDQQQSAAAGGGESSPVG